MARPLGAQNKDKPFRDALRAEIAAAQNDNDFRSLRRIARTLLNQAAEGDVTAIKEIADRLDGKPPQFSTNSADEFRKAIEMSDDELAGIAAGGGTGTAQAQEGSEKLH